MGLSSTIICILASLVLSVCGPSVSVTWANAVTWWACLVMVTWVAFRKESAVPGDAIPACVRAFVQAYNFKKSLYFSHMHISMRRKFNGLPRECVLISTELNIALVLAVLWHCMYTMFMWSRNCIVVRNYGTADPCVAIEQSPSYERRMKIWLPIVVCIQTLAFAGVV